MSKTQYYRQCRLEKENTTTHSYIPEKHAVVGNVLSLRDDNQVWDSGWQVKSAGKKVEASIAEAYENAWKRIWKPSTDLTDRGNK